MTNKYEIGYVDNDSTMSGNSDHLVPSQSAVKSAMAGKMNAPTGTTGQYLRGDGTPAPFPTIPAGQLQSDMAQTNTSSLDYVKNKVRVFNNTTEQFTSFRISANTTVTAGVATFNIADGSGNAIIATGIWKETMNIWIEDGANLYNFSNVTLSVDKKTITVTVKRITFSSSNVLINLLGGVLSALTGVVFASAANGTVVYLSVEGK